MSVCVQYETELAMTSAYSSMDPGGVVSSLGPYDVHSAAAAAAGRSMMLHSPPTPHYAQQQPLPVPPASHRQSPSTPLSSAGVYHTAAAAAAAQLTGYGAPAPAGSGAAGYGVAATTTPGVSPGAGAPSNDAPAKRDRDSIYGFVRRLACCVSTGSDVIWCKWPSLSPPKISSLCCVTPHHFQRTRSFSLRFDRKRKFHFRAAKTESRTERGLMDIRPKPIPKVSQHLAAQQIFYSPHYSDRENKRTRNTTKQKNKQYKSTRTDQTLDIMQFIAVHTIIFPNEVLFTLFKLFTW